MVRNRNVYRIEPSVDKKHAVLAYVALRIAQINELDREQLFTGHTRQRRCEPGGLVDPLEKAASLVSRRAEQQRKPPALRQALDADVAARNALGARYDCPHDATEQNGRLVARRGQHALRSIDHVSRGLR